MNGGDPARVAAGSVMVPLSPGPDPSASPRPFTCIPSPTEALASANTGGTTTSTKGVEVNSHLNNISLAVAAAEAADAVVMLVGIDGHQENEEHDRANCTLPPLQEQLVGAIGRLGKPTVLVLINGGAICLGPIQHMSAAIVEAFYGGEAAAEAIAQVIFGGYNPTGKLPVTMYPPRYMRDIPITQMSVTAPPGRTHLYYSGTPDFAFGSGLSYSRWAIELLPSTTLLPTEVPSPTAEVPSPTAEVPSPMALPADGGALEVTIRVTHKWRRLSCNLGALL